MNIYTVKSTDIVHNTSVDLITRWSTREVHIVQYDNSQPIVAVELFKNSERFVLPDGYEANLRFGKKDRTFIYKPVLGCNQGRDTVYFAVDEQMSMFYGKVTPIIELTYNGAVVGSSSIPFVIDRNPIQIGDVESKTDYPAIVERISAAEAAAADAKKAVDAEVAERAAGDAKTLSDARAYTDSSTSGLVSDNTTIKSNIITLQSDMARLKTDNTQNKTDIATKQDKLVSGMNIKTINGNSILGTGDITISGGGTNYITETTDKLILKPVNTNGNDFEVRTKDNDVVVSFTQNAPGNSSSYSLFDVILSTAPNEDGELYNIVARFTKDENWDAKLNLSANAGSIGAGFDITIPPDAYGNIAMASDLEPLKTSIGNKQDTLVSGTNIKTINGESILGSGNIAISGGSGLASPWVSEEKCIGITDNQGFYMGLLNVFNAALYGEVIYDSKNSDLPPLAACVMGLSCDNRNNNIIMFSDTETNVNSSVKLPDDFKTRSQTITLQDKLVSGINIKTINGMNILGSGNINIDGGSGGSGSGSGSRPPLYSHTITLRGSAAYFTFTIYVRTDEEVTKDTLFDYLGWFVCGGIGVASNALIDKIDFSANAGNTLVHQFLELGGQRIDKNITFDSAFGTDFIVEDVVRGPDWIPPR